MGSVLFKQLVLIVIIALALQCSSTALANQPMISTDKPSYNPWETVDISINETSNITAHVIDPWSSLTELILTPSEDGYLTEYSPQQGVVLGTYTILVSGEEVYEISQFDIRTLSITPYLEQYYTIGDIQISGNVVDTTTNTPVNASVNITIDGQTINAYATEGDFSTTYMADSMGQKTVSITAIDDENIIGTSNAGFEVYSSNTGNLTITTSKETYEANQNVEVDVTSELGEPVIWITDPLGNPTYLTVHETQGAYWGKLHLDNQIILGEYWAQAQGTNSTEEVKIPFNVVAPSQAPESEPETTPENPEISYSRLLSGHKVGQHKVPPIKNIETKVTVEVTSPVTNASIVDYYPEDWFITDPMGGIVDMQNSTITWNVGDIDSIVSRTYTIFTPQRTMPSTKYYFSTELENEELSEMSNDWMVLVADPDPPSGSNLRSPSADSGAWSIPAGAYVDDDSAHAYATSKSVAKGPPSHIYSGYGFNIPSNVIIDSVRVRTDAWTNGNEKLRLYISEDGGSSWSDVIDERQLTDTETPYWIDVTGWTTWTPAKINNDNIQTKVDAVTVGGADEVNLDWIPIEVNYSLETSWSTDTLGIGEGVKNQGSPAGTVDITAIGNNKNVTVEFVSGDSGKFSHNWTTADINNGESRTIEFTCDDSENGDFSAVFNVTSDGATAVNQITVTATIFSYATLDVILDQPIDGLVVNPGDTFTINATVTCVGEPGSRPGDIYALARYGNLTADTNISTTSEATPFFIAGADGEANFSTGEQIISNSATGAYSVYAIDIDEDGDTDVLSASVDADEIAWYENDGSETFTEHVLPYTADGAESVYATDLDSDGDIDILSASFVGDKIAWYENDGNEAFTERTISATANGANSVYAIDVDGDEDIDVLSSLYFENRIAWYENNGAESFTEHTLPATALGTYSVYASDVDSDGDIDLLSAAIASGSSWYENDGSESFTEHSLTGSSASSVYAIDMDGDNDIDILSAQQSGSDVVWHKNIGSGSFTTHVISNSISDAQCAYAIDVDSDGDIDVLTASSGDNKIVLYENDGSESFNETVISNTAVGARSVYATDVDGDGYVDVLSASQNDNKIAWYENTQTAIPSSNPKTSPTTMNPDDTWNVSWTVNVTGENGNQYEADVLFYSSYGNSNVPDNDTADSTVIIGSSPIQLNYTYFSVTKTIEPGASTDNYNVTLNLTSLVDFNKADVRAYDIIPINFTIADPVPNYNGSQSNIYYWSLDLAAGESKTINYTLVGSGKYSLTDTFIVGVDPV